MSPTRSIEIEIRPGEGGEDAEAFAAELVAAVSAHARRHAHTTTVNRPGRTVTVRVSGTDPAAIGLERLAGVHRIQRIPRNDTRGRRHTSTATIAILEPDTTSEVSDVTAECVIQYYRASGKGGQHRNKTETAVRLRHVPSGIVVHACRERSREQNLSAACAELTRRLRAAERDGAQRRRNTERRTQIADGTRPVKQFTWNDQRDEVIEHSSGRAAPMSKVLRGKLELLA